jgi:hypothetical protein
MIVNVQPAACIASTSPAGGTARIDRIEGKGTNVRLYLPRLRQVVAVKQMRASQIGRAKVAIRPCDAFHCHIQVIYRGGRLRWENNLNIRKSVLHIEKTATHPFESCFLDLGGHSAERALAALTAAIHAAQREVNAFDWIERALPGTTLKPALAFGTVGELYRAYTRPAELGRMKGVMRF